MREMVSKLDIIGSDNEFRAKPLSKLMLAYFEVIQREQISVNFE